MTTILALDTTTDNCSVALWHNGACTQRLEVLPRQHNQFIHRMIDQLLADSDITLQQVDYVAVTNGPGSFTGIRLGLSVAQGLAYGLDVPIIPVMTLDAMAYYVQSIELIGNVLVGLDARMGEIYWGLYALSTTDSPVCVTGPMLTKPDGLPASIPTVVCGSVWDQYLAADSCLADCQRLVGADAHPQARFVAACAAEDLSCAVSPHNIQAVYLRNQVVHQ